MLALRFQVQGEPCALRARDVAEVLPLLPCRRLPGLPDFVVGVFDYRGRAAVLLDLQRLLGYDRTAPRLSSRVAVLAREGRPLGLLLGGATDTLRYTEEALEPAPLQPPGRPVLGPLIHHGDGLVQLMEPDALLTETEAAAVEAALAAG